MNGKQIDFSATNWQNSNQNKKVDLLETQINYCYFFGCSLSQGDIDLAIKSNSHNIFYWFRLATLLDKKRDLELSKIAWERAKIKPNVDEIDDRKWLVLDNFDSFDRWEKHPNSSQLLNEKTSLQQDGVYLSHINQKDYRDIRGYILTLNQFPLQNDRCLVFEFLASEGTPVVLDVIIDGNPTRYLDYLISDGNSKEIYFLLNGEVLNKIVLSVSEPIKEYSAADKYTIILKSLKLGPKYQCTSKKILQP